MKIFVLNGSPKKEKSDTMHITRAFLRGMMETAYHEIQMIHVMDRHIDSAPAVLPVCETAVCAATTTICDPFWSKFWKAICCCSAFLFTAMECLPC